MPANAGTPNFVFALNFFHVRSELTASPNEAAAFIKRGGIVAFPTETVYGLGADAFDEDAIAKIFEAKRRPADNPLIAHVGSLDQIGELAVGLTPTAHTLVDQFFPGPLTLVLKKSGRVPMIATAGLETVGVRMPSGKLAREFLRACSVPVVAPSANISGRPSPTTWEAVFEDLNGRIDCILQGEPTDFGIESTVVDCTTDTPLLLRVGAVSIEDLRAVVPSIEIYNTSGESTMRSPGMRHKHYAPSATVVVVDPGFEIPKNSPAAYIGLTNPRGSGRPVKICDSVEDYARSVFAFFRECDVAKIETIYCERVDERGIGTALMDRLGRAEAR